MKTLTILTLLIATTAVAGAAPSVVATRSRAPAVYVQAGTEVGGSMAAGSPLGFYDSIHPYRALVVDAGLRLARSPFWIHGVVAAGDYWGNAVQGGSNVYQEARVGLEARRCATTGVACVVAGLDLGGRRARAGAAAMTFDDSAGLLVPRLGLDLGTQHLRARPGVELAIDHKGHDSNALSLGVAYLW